MKTGADFQVAEIFEAFKIGYLVKKYRASTFKTCLVKWRTRENMNLSPHRILNFEIHRFIGL